MAAVQTGEFGAVTAIVVDIGGGVDAHYFSGDESTLRNTRSATKTITGTLVGIAIDRGELGGVETRILDVLDDLVVRNPDPRKHEITVEDFLTMSSLLECDDWNELSAGNEERMYLVDDWVEFTLGLPLRDGRGFSYCTAGVSTLGAVLERATGVPVPAYAARSTCSIRSGSRTRRGRSRRAASRRPAAASSFARATLPSWERSIATGVAGSSRLSGSRARRRRRRASTIATTTDISGG